MTLPVLNRDYVQEALKRARPSLVRATLDDGTIQEMAIPESRKRWQVLATQVSQIQTRRLELVDQAGHLIDVLDAPEPQAFKGQTEAAVAAGSLMLKAVTDALGPLTQALIERDATVAESYARLIEAVQTENHALRERARELEDKVQSLESDSTLNSPEGREFMTTLNKLAPLALRSYLTSKTPPGGPTNGNT